MVCMRGPVERAGGLSCSAAKGASEGPLIRRDRAAGGGRGRDSRVGQHHVGCHVGEVRIAAPPAFSASAGPTDGLRAGCTRGTVAGPEPLGHGKKRPRPVTPEPAAKHRMVRSYHEGGMDDDVHMLPFGDRNRLVQYNNWGHMLSHSGGTVSSIMPLLAIPSASQ